MRSIPSLLLALFLFAIVPAMALEKNQPPQTLPLDLTTAEYQVLWHNYLLSAGEKALADLEPATKESIAAGEKLALWLKTINQERSPEHQIRLTSPGTRSGIPIETPSIYGPKQITETLGNLKKTLPAEILQVVYGTTPVSSNFSGTEEDFIKNARKVDHLYQTSVRWASSIKPWLSWYKSAKALDVRGHYFLNKIIDLDAKLQNFAALPEAEQNTLKEHLIGLCRNSRRTQSECEQSFVGSRSSNQILGYKKRYWATSQAVWDSFFKITDPRSDVTWTSANPNHMEVTFKDPSNNRVRDFLQDNIEDEYKFGDWHLGMTFNDGRSGTSYVEFQPNVTPHVTGGNVVVMDANAPLEEYEVQWTIRHEYGHILRLPDCYVEFYDDVIESVVNYQLDISDLMCSRAGNMNERIYLELKRAYLK